MMKGRVPMHVLPKERYPEARPMFGGYDHQLIVASVLEGNTRGEIYVDDMENPKTAVLYGIGFEVLCAGDPNHISLHRELPDLLANRLMPSARSYGMPALNVYFPSEAWEKALHKALSDRFQLAAVKKRFYTFESDGGLSHMEMPTAPGLTRIDDRLLNDETLRNRDALLQWVGLSWLSLDDFARKGIGYCIVEEGTIASWCLSVFASGNRLELALYTDESFRNKGCAKKVSAACVARCLADGCVPLWTCDDDNLPSIRVAEALGFRRTLDYHVLQIKL